MFPSVQMGPRCVQSKIKSHYERYFYSDSERKILKAARLFRDSFFEQRAPLGMPKEFSDLERKNGEMYLELLSE